MPCSRAMRLHSAIGWIVPTSLLACMMLTRIVRGVIARRRSSGSTRPKRSTGRYVTRAPSRSRNRHGSMIAGCSIRVVMMWSPLSRQREEHALEREVVGLAAAAREDDLVAVRSRAARRPGRARARARPWRRAPPNARSTDCRNAPQETAASRRRPPGRSACWRCSRDRCGLMSSHRNLLPVVTRRCVRPEARPHSSASCRCRRTLTSLKPAALNSLRGRGGALVGLADEHDGRQLEAGELGQPRAQLGNRNIARFGNMSERADEFVGSSHVDDSSVSPRVEPVFQIARLDPARPVRAAARSAVARTRSPQAGRGRAGHSEPQPPRRPVLPVPHGRARYRRPCRAPCRRPMRGRTGGTGCASGPAHSSKD